MSKAVQAVLAIVEIIVGAYFGQGWLVSLGVSQLLSVAAQLLISPHRPPVSPVDVNYAGTLEPRRILYGTMKLGGMHCVPPLTSGANNDFLHVVLALTGHSISGFGDVYLGQTRIANADIASVTGSSGDGLVSNAITNNGYQNRVWIRRYDGTQTSSDFILTSNFTQWDANHIGHGIAYAAFQFQFDQNVFASGLPDPSLMVIGKKIYDPRLDSTNGGSGPQRYTTPSTWTYSSNPALCLRDFLTSALGLNEQQTRIDDSLVAAAANICDQTVTVPIPVLVGLTAWQNGVATVGGTGTAFLKELNNGQFTGSAPNFTPTVATYVKAPNGSMLQVSTVQSDTQFTLTAVYPGSTAANQTSQWNNSTATSTTQPRYTCNTLLDATVRYEDNIAQLARGMMGQCVYQSGKWRMYAGAWTGSAFALSQDDLVGTFSLQCGTPRQTLYNAVRGNYLNPQKAYQPDEFPAIINSTYAAADGETIYSETNFPCCTNIFECQRNANVLVQVSRDQKIVTAQFGMSAYGIKVWETGTVTISEIGWNAQSVRCIGWRFQAQGVVELTLQEAYSADWTDLALGSYVTKSVNVTPSPSPYLPYPPTALTATPVAGGIEFALTLPAQLPAGQMVQLWQGATATPFSSAVLVQTATSTAFFLPVFDTITRFYWVTTVGPNGQRSTPFPAVTGVSGWALSASNNVWQPWATILNAQSFDTGAVKVGGSGGFDSALYSVNAYTTAHIRGKANQTGLDGAFGFAYGSTGGAAPSPALATLVAAWRNNAGTWQIVEAGTLISSQGAVSLQDVAWITDDGANFNYYLNDPTTAIRTVANTGASVIGMVCLDSVGVGFNSLTYGPTTDLELQDTAQLGQNAATAIAFVAQTFAGGTTFGAGSNQQVGTGVSFTIPPGSVGVEITVSCDIAADGGPDSSVFFFGGVSGHLGTVTEALWQGSGATRGLATGTVQVTGLAAGTYTAALYCTNVPGTAGVKCYAYALSVNGIKR